MAHAFPHERSRVLHLLLKSAVYDGSKDEATPGERVRRSLLIYLAAPAHRTVVREGPKPARPTGRIARGVAATAAASSMTALLLQPAAARRLRYGSGNPALKAWMSG